MLAKELLKKGVAKESEGALIVDLQEYNLGIYVILTKEGHAVYHSKDLALAELKLKEFKNLDKSIHVVGKEQELYFKQLFKTFELIKSKLAGKSYHLIYGLVMLPEGKMSSREGNIILYRDLIQSMMNKALEEVKKRHPEWSKTDIEKSAQNIAFGALKYSMINRENNKEIIFDWEKSLEFEGATGPYIQYAHARICSILKKYNKPVSNSIDFNQLSQPEESSLIKKLEEFPLILQHSASTYKPYLLANYVFELAQLFNEFYHKYNILKEDENIKKARILLIFCIQQVLENGLKLLGIEAPEKM